MSDVLNGQVTVVTGAASGIGLASARALRAAGSLLDPAEVAEVILFMLTRPRAMTIRDVVPMPTHFDL